MLAMCLLQKVFTLFCHVAFFRLVVDEVAIQCRAQCSSASSRSSALPGDDGLLRLEHTNGPTRLRRRNG